MGQLKQAHIDCEPGQCIAGELAPIETCYMQPENQPGYVIPDQIGTCDDCENSFNTEDLYPYKYEPGYKLCLDCLDARMEEE